MPLALLFLAPDFVVAPETCYEKVGTYIPNVIFPSANVVKDGLVYLYYGCCDTSIGLATAPLSALVDLVLGRKSADRS